MRARNVLPLFLGSDNQPKDKLAGRITPKRQIEHATAIRCQGKRAALLVPLDDAINKLNRADARP